VTETAQAPDRAATLAVEHDQEDAAEGLQAPGEAPPVLEGQRSPNAFSVHLDNFEGPFDLLLGLISKHKLDVTEVALSQVTDEFIAHIRAKGEEWDLGQATEFLVVASTLLDLKTARLLPSAEIEDEEDLALLEARDLLFARLLQYRAYKEVSADFARRIADESRRHPRTVALDPHLANLLPEVLLGLGPEQFAALAAKALTPKVMPTVGVEHIHAPRVSVKEQGVVLVERLRRVRSTTFRQLTADCPDTLTVVARFLALLELFRDGAVAFEQVAALGELHVRWTGSEDDDVEVTDEFDVEPVLETDDDGPPAAEVTDADIAAVGRAVDASPTPQPTAEPAPQDTAPPAEETP
jgi:segregation and condensation protein A